MGNNRGAINVKGGGSFQLREITSGGVGTTFDQSGFLRSSKFTDSPEMIKAIADSGDVVNVIVGDENAMFECNLMQSAKADFDFIRGARGKFFEVYYKVLTQEGLYVQEFDFPICKISPKLELSFTSNEIRVIPVTVYLLKPKGAYTRTPTEYNNADASYWVMVENVIASIVGPPTDTTGAVYTAVY